MLYTSYFGQLRNFPTSFIPIAICAKPPIGYSGLSYKKPAPSYQCLMDYKANHDVDAYCKRYYSETLNKLSAETIINDIWSMLPETTRAAMNSDSTHWTQSPLVHIVLLCYEKPSDFCHRNLVADKLTEAGYPCKEWIR